MTTLTAIELESWNDRLRTHMAGVDLGQDPAHDLAHFERVVRSALALARADGARFEVVLPAAWLHDLVNVPKNDPRRTQASRLSAKAAVELLSSWGYPTLFMEDIAHAIEAHSFSAKIEPRTLEAKIVQDADRLDALGAIGVARLYSTAQVMGSRYYDPQDPLAERRERDDRRFALDHFFVKLFPLVETLRTSAGRQEGLRRTRFMREFIDQFTSEIKGEFHNERPSSSPPR